MGDDDRLQLGIACLERGQWSDADAHLTAAQEAGGLPPAMLEQLAIARHLIDRQEASEETWISAHEGFLRAADHRGAARCAFWLGLLLMLRGDAARGGGWLGRAHEALAGEAECAEHGLLISTEGLHAMFSGHPDEAEVVFRRVREVGDRHHAPDVIAFADLGAGQCLVRQGRAVEGLAALDRVMAGIDSGALSPILTGIVYCAAIEECQRVFDVARAREWTTGLTRWLGSQPGLVAFQGQCLVYRAEVVQRHGDWPAAVDEAERARDRLSSPPGHPATGLALYRLGELHRLRGELDEAEAAYTEANGWGRSPQPGLALLRLAQGDAEAASVTIRRVLGEVSEPATRCDLLAAAVRILIAHGDIGGARAAADELAQKATDFGAPFLQALADHCRGAVALADGRADAAVAPLQSSLQVWLELQAPHEEALTRVALGTAYRELGDHDSARLELETARRLLAGLDAAPDLAWLDELTAEPAPEAAAEAPELSLRELQVLRLLATGATNRSIADALYISVRTVDRHVSNLFTKLGVSTRAAATACAFERQLI